ncbi:hypothetical protein, partial [Caenibacillus caldisaponilyticus]|uniref:hypothetical protein n=1 Tax=Caenibacillus caldisaponilyticus TaxID=1674942 RepID=UPI001EE6F071
PGAPLFASTRLRAVIKLFRDRIVSNSAIEISFPPRDGVQVLPGNAQPSIQGPPGFTHLSLKEFRQEFCFSALRLERV